MFLSNCSGDLDLSGFLHSHDRVNTRFEQSEAWNKTHPFKILHTDSENYQLLVAADNHIGGLKNFKIFLEEAKLPENLAFVLVGDFVTGKKEDYLAFKNELPDFDEVPYFLMAGNHELYFDGWKTFYEFFGSSTYYFSVQTPTVKDLYICLDSGSGTLGNKQIAWLKNVLETERENYKNCIVFSHVNFFRGRHTRSTNPLVAELEVLMGLFADNKVNMVIMGHDHIRAVNPFGYTTYLTLDAMLDNFSKASFMKLKISEGKVGFEFREIE
jgi:hypothetical protein